MADKKYPWEENLDWYKPSGAVQDAYAQYDSLIGQKPGEYQNAWGSQIGDLYDQITNRPAFNYDLNADALYNQYKDQYQRLGNRAMQDTIGQASALTGGYGSTYGATVGQQQYNQYMESLNNIVPELEQNAYSKYQQQGQDLYNLYGMALDRESTDYGRYQDSMSNWMNQQNAAYGRYMDQMGFDYGQQQDLRNYDFQQEQFGYGQEQDALAQQNWQTQFGYGQEQDALAQQNWQTQFGYGQEQDALAQQNWQTQFDYGMETDEKQQAYALAMTLLQSGKSPSAELLAKAGIDKATAAQLKALPMALPMAVSTGSSSNKNKKNSNGKKLTDSAWDQLFAAGLEGKDAYMSVLAQLDAKGFDVKPGADYGDKYYAAQWDAKDKVLRDSANHMNNFFKTLTPEVNKAMNPNLTSVAPANNIIPDYMKMVDKINLDKLLNPPAKYNNIPIPDFQKQIDPKKLKTGR